MRATPLLGALLDVDFSAAPCTASQELFAALGNRRGEMYCRLSQPTSHIQGENGHRDLSLEACLRCLPRQDSRRRQDRGEQEVEVLLTCLVCSGLDSMESVVRMVAVRLTAK